MAPKSNGQSIETGTLRLKTGLAEMLKGGVIMDVTDADQAKIAEDAGAVSVMALERVPSDIRKEGGVARMASISKMREIMNTVTIPVMAKVRIGHFAEAQILQTLGVDYVDESEVLTPADEHYHIDKFAFDVPFVCGCRNLGEALRRIGEGACMIRTKGEAGSGNTPPVLKFAMAGEEGRGPGGVVGGPVGASVGVPTEVSVWAHDDGTRSGSVSNPGRDAQPVKLAWCKHQGPGTVTFSEPQVEVEAQGGEARTTATFDEPGEYVLRVRANDASGVASAGHAQCCWTNGFVTVTVTR